jgi:hypothetical protein
MVSMREPVGVKSRRLREVTLLEDPDHDPEGGRKGRRAEDQSLQRDEQAAKQQHEYEEGRAAHQEQRRRQVMDDDRRGVHQVRREAAHQNGEGRRGGPDGPYERLPG